MNEFHINQQEKFNEYEAKIVSLIFSDEEAMNYFIQNPIDVRFFKNLQNYRVIKTFYSLVEAKKEPTVELIIEEQAPETVVEKSNWELYFENLQFIITDLATAKTYCEMLKKRFKIDSYKEFAMKLKERVENEAISPTKDDLTSLDDEIEVMFAEQLKEYRPTDRKDFTMSTGFNLVKKTMEEAKESNNSEITPTGYPEIDKKFNGGHFKGTYTIYAGRPGSGKTLIMINEALESVLANPSKQKSLFISIEMTAIQCFQRIIAKLANIDAGKLQNPSLMDADDWNRMAGAAEQIVEVYDGNFWVIEVTALTINRLRMIIQEYKRKYGLDSVYVDYAQIMSTEKGDKPEKESDYSAISEGLRKTAKGENVSIIVGSQVGREVEKRPDKRPLLSDLRNSGAFEQDAARVVMIYRDEYYHAETTEEPGIMEYIIAKNRFGPTGTVKLKYDAPKQNILSIASAA